ncbi:sporulation-induced protein [Lodderomyces elongisporus]|uniref:sporulation-induced protein n=1 Tax=Lodderomyces elongisporus TaxID=36914 RepID=UPI0029258085|nr:sporulation-induced protein [Lodderomyces elongisporus]WLF79206.1 sporulation-induced protein [Lodderomyces elongisporus]
MSFWPFNNSFNNNNALSKFLDSVHDLSLVTIEDMTKDPTLMQEIINELHNIKGHYNNAKNGSFQFSPTGAENGSDSASFTSSTDNSNSNSTKEIKDGKLIELLIQPHILRGFIVILEESVEFFHQLRIKEEEKIVNSIEENNPTTDIEENDEMEEAKTEVETPDEKFRKCVQSAADILAIDMWIISNRIIETPGIMDELWSLLKLPNLHENSPTVPYLVRILDQLLDLNSIELLNYVRRQENLVDTFLDKIEVPAIMDFFFRIIQTDKPDSPTGILETIASQGVIKKLIEILKPQSETQFENTPYIPDHQQYFRQSSATDFLKALVTISSNAALAVVMETNIGPNQLTRELVTPEIVNTIIHDIMLKKVKDKDGKIQTNKHGINNCVSIIIELIRKNNSDYDLNCGSYSSMLQTGDGTPGEVNSFVMFQWLKDFEQNPPSQRDPIYLGDMLQLFSENLSNFQELLEIEPIPPSKVQTDILGFTRFKISELIAELLHCSNMILLNSKKIRRIIRIRDQIRSQQSKRLRKALEDKIAFKETNAADIHDVTLGLDDVSLDDVHFDTHLHNNNVHDDERHGNDDDDDDDDDDDEEGEKEKEEKEEEEKEGEEENHSNINNHDDVDKAGDERRGDENSLSHDVPTPNSVSNSTSALLKDLELTEDSEDEEPSISPENPFVCTDRDAAIRSDPCVGDYFKIKLIDSNILANIVSKFTKYEWNNFFHNVVFDLIQQIFNGKLNSYNSYLIVELFKTDKCDLTGVIARSFEIEIEPRPGYMGHLILIGEEIVKFTSLYKPDLISPVIVEAVSNQRWIWFINEVLSKTREIYNVVLGADNGDEDTDYGFDTSTVGYLDADEPKKIILGDSSNHDEFVRDNTDSSLNGGFNTDKNANGNAISDENANANTKTNKDKDEDEDMYMDVGPRVADVEVGRMTPDGNLSKHKMLEDDDEDDMLHSEHAKYDEDLSGSSSEEDDEDEEDDDASNELRRVSKHTE